MIGTADAITTSTSKQSGNNVFGRNQTTKKVPRNIFRCFEVRRNV